MRIAVLLTAACAAASAQTLDGVVVNSVTGAPVKKARISLAPRTEGLAVITRNIATPQTNVSAVTDASGRFHIESVAPGEQTALAVAQGFAFGMVKISVADAAKVTIALTPLGVVTGKVRDEAGDPVSGLNIIAASRDYTRAAARFQDVASAVTDDRGEYRLFDVAAGRYYVQLAMPASTSTPSGQLFYPGVLEISGASMVDVDSGAETGGIDFTARPIPVYHVVGHALDAQTGEPLDGVVSADHCGGGPRLPVSAPVHRDGVFDIRIAHGTYCLRIETAGTRPVYGMRRVSVADRDLEGVPAIATGRRSRSI